MGHTCRERSMVAKRSSYVPDRGDIVWINFNPIRGHEQKGKRPALVISPKLYNGKTSLMLACPLTTNAKGYPFEVATFVGKTESVVLVDHVRSVDWVERNAHKIQKTTPAVLSKVQGLLKKIIFDS